MSKTITPELRFFCKEYPSSGNYSTIEHIATVDGAPLCGSRDAGQIYGTADWEALHSPRFHRQCPRCRKAAFLVLRPRASFWYLDPFHGNMKEFKSLRAAVSSAKKEHGNSTIWQVGPGDVNKIVLFVKGLDVLP